MALIGICGKAGAGKDLVGNIIQYLLWHKAVEEKGASMHLTLKDFVDSQGHRVSKDIEGWEIKKFADKLKDIVCILIGCTRWQLEDQEFKAKELGEEWDCMSYQDAGNWKIPPHPNTPEWPPLLSIEVIPNMLNGYKRKLTPRTFLQLLGTECGRQIIHPNVWVNALMCDYRESQISPISEFKTVIAYPNWIITDVRFPNEVKAIKDRGGIVIKKLGLDSSTGTHESETALDDYVADYTIPYYEDVQMVIDSVEQILIKEKIL